MQSCLIKLQGHQHLFCTVVSLPQQDRRRLFRTVVSLPQQDRRHLFRTVVLLPQQDHLHQFQIRGLQSPHAIGATSELIRHFSCLWWKVPLNFNLDFIENHQVAMSH